MSQLLAKTFLLTSGALGMSKAFAHLLAQVGTDVVAAEAKFKASIGSTGKEV